MPGRVSIPERIQTTVPVKGSRPKATVPSPDAVPAPGASNVMMCWGGGPPALTEKEQSESADDEAKCERIDADKC